MNTIPKEALVFLDKLKKNNNREWFAENKEEFKQIENQMKLFYSEVEKLMKKHDDILDFKAYRIYRDIRFSKDKTPYKSHFSAHFARKKPELRGGYYLHIEPEDNSFLAAGFWNPVKEDVLRVRKEWNLDTTEIRKIVTNKNFVKTWGQMEGEKLKTAPSGFSKDHPDIGLINYKQWYFLHPFTDPEILSDDFGINVNQCYKKIRPFFDYMSEVLTTDLNGVSLI